MLFFKFLLFLIIIAALVEFKKRVINKPRLSVYDTYLKYGKVKIPKEYIKEIKTETINNKNIVKIYSYNKDIEDKKEPLIEYLKSGSLNDFLEIFTTIQLLKVELDIKGEKAGSKVRSFMEETAKNNEMQKLCDKIDSIKSELSLNSETSKQIYKEYSIIQNMYFLIDQICLGQKKISHEDLVKFFGKVSRLISNGFKSYLRIFALNYKFKDTALMENSDIVIDSFKENNTKLQFLLSFQQNKLYNNLELTLLTNGTLESIDIKTGEFICDNVSRSALIKIENLAL